MSILQELLKDHHPRDYAFRLWDGSEWPAETGPTPRCTMVIRNPGSLRAMFGSQGERDLAQAYIADHFDIVGDMDAAIPMGEHLLGVNLSLRERVRLAIRLRSLPSPHDRTTRRQPVRLEGPVHSLERDRQAVTYHYNTSNEFFAIYLDKRMTYSCAYFARPDEDLDAAQERKLDYVCRKLRLRPGERFLDIGCGWGALIMHAAKTYGVSALGITLSEPQARLANERIRQEGLENRCRAEVLDYRTVPGDAVFDKVASIGMVEHVGELKLPEYFGHAWRVLRPGGVFLNHGIAHPPQTIRGASFSQAYVFPDSQPVPLAVGTRAAESAGFEVRDVESLREHYTLTLRHWVRRLEDRHDEAVKETDESTYRAWRLFMSVSARQFERGIYNVYQSLLVKPDSGKSNLPLTRADWYS